MRSEHYKHHPVSNFCMNHLISHTHHTVLKCNVDGKMHSTAKDAEESHPAVSTIELINDRAQLDVCPNFLQKSHVLTFYLCIHTVIIIAS